MSYNRKRQRRVKTADIQNQYPEFVLTGAANPDFKELIRDSIARISFDSPAFSDWERSVYRLLRSDGFLAAYNYLRGLIAHDVAVPNGEFPREMEFAINLGHQVFLTAGNSLKQFLLKNDVVFYWSERVIVAKFRMLESCGGVVRSPLHPEIVIDGKSYVVGFKGFEDHAIKQVGLRSAQDWESYAGHGEVFHFFYDCKHLVGCTVKHNKTGEPVPAMSIFENISTPTGLRVFKLLHLALHGLVTDDGSGLFARIGYCPVEIDGDFANARTLLLPGYRCTPEASLYEDNSLPPDLRERLCQIGTANDPGHGTFHTDPRLLGFFHEHGFPQVVRGSDPCFSHVRQSASK